MNICRTAVATRIWIPIRRFAAVAAQVGLLRLVCSVASVALTLLGYRARLGAHSRFRSPLTNPVFLAAAGVMLVLAIPGLDDVSYRRGTEPLVALLGPATAALALPLYKHRRIAIVYFWPAITGLASGAIATLFAAMTRLGNAVACAASPITAHARPPGTIASGLVCGPPQS